MDDLLPFQPKDNDDETTTRIKGTFDIDDPTVTSLEKLLCFITFSRNEYNPRKMAEMVMERIGKPADIQIGPGVNALTFAEGDKKTLRIKWDAFWSIRG